MPPVRRVQPDQAIRMTSTLQDADYTDSFEVRTGDGDSRSGERWARDALEGMPVALRWLVLIGWKAVLGLRLGPAASPEHVLGWQIADSTPTALLLEARSPLLVAQLAFRPTDSEMTWGTFVQFERSLGRVVWLAVGLLHRRIVPYVLGRAARRPRFSM